MAFLAYDISVVGLEKVRQATRAVEQELLASNRRLLSSTGAGKTRATGGASSPANESRRRTNEEVKEERVRVREHERAERDKTRATVAEARKREQAEVAIQRQRSSALLKQYHTEEAAARRAREAYKRGTTGVLTGTAGRVAAVGRGAIAATGIGGGALFAAGVHGAMRNQAAASNLANQLLGNGANAESLGAKKREILAAVGATNGFAPTDVIAGMSRFQGIAGEGEATMKMAPALAQMSLATDASMEDLGDMFGSMYAAIRNSAGGATKSVDDIIKETERLGRVFGAMGQVGAVELKDVASVGSEITAAAMSYSGDIVSNIRKVGAMMQIAKQTGGAGGMGGAEAATAVQNFANDLVQHKDATQRYLQQTYGQNATIFADKGRTKLKSLDVLLPELMGATGGDLTKMGDILNIRGTRGLKGFTESYQEAYQASKKNKGTDKQAREAGMAAVSKRFSQFAGIEMTSEEVKAKAESRLSDADKQFEDSLRKLTAAAGNELLPALTQLIPSVAKLAPHVADASKALANLVSFIADNPLAGLGALIGVSFAAEMAKAGIGSIVEKTLSSAVGAGGGAGGRMLGVAGVGLAAGAASYTGISYAGRSEFSEASKGTSDIMRGLSGVHGASLGSALNDAQSKLRAIEDEKGMFGGFMDMFGAGTSGEIQSAQRMIDQKKAEYSEFQRTGKLSPEAEADIKALQDSTGATEKLTAAINTLTNNLPAVSINTSNRPSAPVK